MESHHAIHHALHRAWLIGSPSTIEEPTRGEFPTKRAQGGMAALKSLTNHHDGRSLVRALLAFFLSHARVTADALSTGSLDG